MKKAGEVLKATRIRKKITLEEASRVTKIKKEILEALEESDFLKIPSVPYSYGFVKNYAKFLGLDQKLILAFFKREQRVEKGSTAIFYQPQTKRFFLPRKNIFLFGSVLGFFLIVYVVFQFQNFLSPPRLVLSSPKDQSKVTIPLVVVSGETEIGSAVLVNGQEVEVDPKGNFSQELKIKEGENKIKIEAHGRLGRKNQVGRTIFFLP